VTDQASEPWGPPTLLRLAEFVEPRGTLTAAERPQLPFPIARYFVVRDVPPGAVRGGHAHQHVHELLNCVIGRCTVEVRWAGGYERYVLDDPTLALHLPPHNWVECRDFSEGATLLVLCSDVHDPSQTVAEPPARPSA
jgi:dTDP-4-dehydrorhamnose 3,5-epimerase-like enzyme